MLKKINIVFLVLVLFLFSTTSFSGVNSYQYSGGFTGQVNTDIASNGTITVVVTNSGTIKTSKDLVTWDDHYGFELNINRVIWNGSKFCAVGDGYSYISSDGISWTKSAALTGFFPTDMIWDGQSFVVTTKTYTKVLVSNDCQSWSISHNTNDVLSGDLNSIAYNGSSYLVFGASGSMSSTDLVTWQAQTSTNLFPKIKWAQERNEYLGMTGWRDIYTSPDGVNWTIDSTMPASPAIYFSRVYWDGSQYIILGLDNSFNGNEVISYGLPGSWNQIFLNGNYYALEKINADYLMVGKFNQMATGKTLPTLAQTSGLLSVFSGLAEQNGVMIAQPQIGIPLRSTDNGDTWSEINISGNTGYGRGVAVSSSGRWVMTYDANTFTSDDAGLTWNNQGATLSNAPNRLVYSSTAGVFLAAGAALETSADGVTWIPSVTPPSFIAGNAIWSPAISKFVISGSGNYALSSDGLNWSAYRCPNMVTYSGSLASSDTKILLDCKTQVYSSTDGINWTVDPLGPSLKGRTLHWNNSEWLAFKEGSYITTSDLTTINKSVTIHPTPITILKENTLSVGTRTISAGYGLAIMDQVPEVNLVEYSTPDNQVSEGAGVQSITVQLSSTSTYDITIPFSLTDITTSVGADYTVTASPLVIKAGNTSGVIDITLIDDTLFEGSESMTLNLGTPVYAVTGTTSSMTITIMDNENNAPVLTPPQAVTVDENAQTGTLLSTLSATDADGDVLSYSISAGNTGGLFAIDSATGAITVAGTLDYESATSHTLTVEVTDGIAITSSSLVVNINNLNDNPVTMLFNSLSTSEQEDISTGTIGRLTAIDADVGTTISYSLTYNPDGLFAIPDPTLGQVHFIGVFDYETATSYSYEITATSSDGSSTSFPITVNITDVNDNPVVLSDSDSNAEWVSEDAMIGTPVGVTASGFDGDASVGNLMEEYFLDTDANGLFTIDAVTGVVTLAGSLDYETATSHVINVGALSTDGSIDIKSFTIHVGDVWEDSDSDGVPDGIDTSPTDATEATPILDSGDVVVIKAPVGTMLSNTQILAINDASLSTIDKPNDVTFDHGVIAFHLKGLNVGETRNVTITYSGEIPSGARIYKIMPDGYVDFSDHATINYVNSTVTITLVDGGAGDADGVANGVIVDPVALATPIATTEPTPTNPAPTNPAPTNPAPTNPAPTNPAPANSGSSGGGASEPLFLLLMFTLFCLRKSRRSRI